ncbi:MAG: hypothetical protein ABI602_01670 [Candidatus Saccharibacteria bacterium]
MTIEDQPIDPILKQQLDSSVASVEISDQAQAVIISKHAGLGFEGPAELHDSQHKNWFNKHRLGLGIAGLAIAGAVSVGFSHDINNTVDDVKSHARIGYVFPITEGAAWAGAGLMLLSAGSKIGNPLTVKKRLEAVRTELEDNQLYKTGWALGALGAVGTSSVIAVGAVSVLPESSWPLAFAASATSLVVSTIPFKPAKTNRAEQPCGSAK